MFSVGLFNLKPGTAKTTSAVWLAHAFAELGHPVLLVDCDPAASALRWSDLAGGFAFPVVGLPVRDAGRRLADYAGPEVIRVVDVPQIEDHAGIARSVLRVVDEATITVAPTPIELDRMGPVQRELDDIEPLRDRPARVAVLLNRVVANAGSGPDTRAVLTEAGYDVLTAQIPRLELYAQSFGTVPRTAGTAYAALAEEYLKRAEAAA